MAVSATSAETRARRSKRTTGKVGREELVLRALAGFRVVTRAVKAHYQWMEAQSGVGGAHLWALSCVSEQPGMSVGELAKTLAIRQSTTSNIVRKLVDDGLLQRKRENGDQRIVQLHLTALGRTTLKRAPTPVKGLLQDALFAMPDARLNALGDLLAEIAEHMHLAHRDGELTPLAELLRGNPARRAGARRPSVPRHRQS